MIDVLPGTGWQMELIVDRRRGRKYLLLLLLVVLGLSACKWRQEPVALTAELGKPVPDFVLKDVSGRLWQLSALRGNVAFVNFWATWCPPCREELPSMGSLARQLRGQPFQMLAILSNDDPVRADNLVRQAAGGSFPVLVDPESKIARAYGITGVPETFIVDRQGILREKIIGPFDWNSKPARQMIERYLP